MNDCCEEWEDVEVMRVHPAIDPKDSYDSREEPHFCPMCGSKLEHTE